VVSVERDLAAIRLPRWGRVEPAEGIVPWLVVDDNGDPVRPVRIFLMDFVAQANGASSVRSYAYALLRWWRWLHAVGVSWDRVTPAEARDLVLWLKQARKRRNSARTSSLKTAGTLNPITGKYYLDDRYAARTIRHSNAVVRAFYQYWIELGEGPVVNPVGLVRRYGSRGNAHHNPLEPFRPEGRLRYNPRLPKRLPREISDDRWRDLFAVLRSNRDRALLSLAISCAARAAEILGVRLADLDWGEQKVRVLRKGTGTAQWLPASPEAFVWIRLYLADLGDTVSLQDPLWQTLRRRDRGEGLRRQPLSYDALRKVVTRANDALGTNYSMHDLRHSAAVRMSRDRNLSLRDIQVILGHQHLSTTADVYLVEDEAAVIQRVHDHLVEHEQYPAQGAVVPAADYDAGDLAILFGSGRWVAR